MQKEQKAGQTSGDILRKPGDSLKIKEKSKAALEYELKKSARDYQLIDRKNNRIVLYNQAHIHYNDIDLQAGIIVINTDKKEVYAGRIPDSTGHLSQRPVFQQGATKTKNDSIRFNFKTREAIVWNTFTKDGDVSLISEVTKKVNDSVNFFKNLKITTAEDIRNPEYYILAKKGKIVPGKEIVVGSSIMYIEEIPTPLILPFGYFPLIQKRTSGFILPNYGEDQRGFFLQNLGFYLVLNKYADLAVLGDIYTNGSYGIQIRNRYKKRYAFDGGFTFKTEKVILGEYGMPDYTRRNIWNLTWSHHKDPKSNPNYNFSANVNIGSSKYYRTSYNVQNVNNVLNNNLSSSVNVSKRFHSIPLSTSLSLLHDQNVNTGKLRFTLPQFYAKLDRIYPFAPKNGIKKNLFQHLNFDYTLNAQQVIDTKDSLFFKKAMWNDAKWGISQRVPLSTNFKIFRYFNFNTSSVFRHVLYGQHINRYWDPAANNGYGAVRDTLIKKPAQFFEWQLNSGMETVIYGLFKFGNKHKIKAIRHILRPSVNFNYRPGFDRYKRHYQASSNPNNWRDYTIFDGGMYGQPAFIPSTVLNFTLSNTFEAKIKDKTGKEKKIPLIKNLNFSGSYNFKADSLKLSFINFNGTVEPIKGLPVRITGSLDPYAVDSLGNNSAQYAYRAGQGWANLRTVRISTGFQLNDKMFRRKKNNGSTAFIGQKNNMADSRYRPAYHNPVHWNLQVSYSLTYNNKRYHPLDPRFIPASPHTINFNGNITFSPGWSMNFTSGYDIVHKKLTYTVLNFRRDLKSWFMSFTWRPLPPYTSWYFYIGIKSSVLRDIKYERRKENLRRFF